MKLINKAKRLILGIAVMLAFAYSCTAANVPAKKEEIKKPFDFEGMIFGHVTNSYSWHICTIQGKAVSIPLLVIVKSPTRGWFVFPSSKIEEGGTYEGFTISKSSANSGKVVELNAKKQEILPFDLSIKKNVFSIIISCIVLIAVFVPMAKGYKKDPLQSKRGFVGSLEMLTTYIVDDVIKRSVGPQYKKFTPYLLTAFYFILLQNFMGLIPIFPGGANITGNISITFILALITFILTNIGGNKHYWKDIFWPDVPLWLKIFPIMPFVEILGIFTKPVALMIRLFANMLSGHMIALVFTGLIFIFYALMGSMAASFTAVISVLFSIFMLFLDLLISFIQAYVFTILSSLFIGLSRVEPEKEKA